jgi:outer membrane protein TolC
MSRRHAVIAFALVFAAGPPRALAGQTLSLGEALRRAETSAYANRVAGAQARALGAQASLALRGVLPSVRVEGGYIRTTDPLGAFGSTLRQRAVTPTAFEPSRLNEPAAIGNVGSALVMEQPIFNADALFGRRAAARAGAAARASEDWARAGTQVDVVRAYFGALLAREQAATLDSSARAAHAHQRVAESQHRNGQVTKSDALLAAVRAGQVDADLIAARAAANVARAQLALALGTPADTSFVLPEHLPDTVAIDRLAGAAATDSLGDRADVRAARLALDAATADRQRATALLLPRVNSFGRLEWNSDDTPFGGRNAWTAGIVVTWSPFSGGAELAERRMAAARRSASAASAEAAEARGRLELQEAANALEVALARMAITGRAVEQSGEAHRIVARKYEGGLATAVELFDAAAEETASRLGFAAARYEAIVAAAQHRRASGRGLADLASLDDVER